MTLMKPQADRLSLLACSEPLSESTEGRRKALLFTASFSILLTVYGVAVNKTPWLDIEVPSGAPNILHGAMSVALAYTFAVFVFHVLTDLRRWRAAGDFLDMADYQKSNKVLTEYATKIGVWVEKLPPEAAAEHPQYGKMVHMAKEYVEQVGRLTARSTKSHATLTRLQAFRLVTLDVGGPMLLGLFALWKIGPALWPFLAAIFT